MDDPTFYATPGPMTDLGTYAAAFDGVGDDFTSVAAAVQGLVLHHAWASRYGVEATDDRAWERQTRSARQMLDAITGLDAAPPDRARPPELRLQGNCRHFATLTCAILRSKAVAVRARCGFGTYFVSGMHEDHWIVELPRDDGWIRGDPQIDQLQREVLGLSDPGRLEQGTFIDASEAWVACRMGVADPETFGIFDMRGLWFVRGNVVRDLAALNKIELLPWDAWGIMLDGASADANDGRLDDIAGVVSRACIDDVRALYDADEGLRPGPTVTSFTADGPREVTL